MAYYIAYVSWGKDSLAMLLRILNENKPLDEVVFYDTGMEFQAIYSTRDKALPLLESHGVLYTELHPENPFLYDMLDRPVKGRERTGYGWCGGLCRWGTAHKCTAMDKYKLQHNDIVEYIGIAADETRRIKNKVYPLVTWGMTEADCLKYCYSRGYEWIEDGGAGAVRLYDILDRVSCWCCCNKNIKELRNIYRFLPEYWQKLRYLQSALERPIKGYYKGQPKGIFELEERFFKEVNNDTVGCLWKRGN